MKSIREYLQENKIFFDTAAAMLLSIMAIIVAAANLFVAIDQRNLTQIQTKVAEANALPRFEISFRSILNEETGKIDNSNLIIENNGGAVREFRAQNKELLYVEAGKGSAFAKRDLPVSGLFGAQVIESAGTGKLSTFIGIKNNQRRSELQQKIRDIRKEKNFDFINVNFATYVKISYKDLLDRSKVEYFELRGVGYASIISNDTGAAIFPEKLSIFPVDISKLDPIKLIDDLNITY